MENPLIGSFNRERTSLVFRQRSLEFFAAYAGLGVGGAMVLVGLTQRFFGFFDGIFTPGYNTFFGLLFLGASIWAMLLFRTVKFDLRKRTFVSRSRLGLLPKFESGTIQEIRCLELVPYAGLIPTSFVQSVSPGMIAAPVQHGQLFVIRLWWHNPHRPPIVIEHVQIFQTYGAADGHLLTFAAKAQMYAQSLQVPLYSNIPLPGMQRVP
jgi:hypothetical protein